MNADNVTNPKNITNANENLIMKINMHNIGILWANIWQLSDISQKHLRHISTKSQANIR